MARGHRAHTLTPTHTHAQAQALQATVAATICWPVHPSIHPSFPSPSIPLPLGQFIRASLSPSVSQMPGQHKVIINQNHSIKHQASDYDYNYYILLLTLPVQIGVRVWFEVPEFDSRCEDKLSIFFWVIMGAWFEEVLRVEDESAGLFAPRR